MLFDLANYWIFILLCAVVYVALTMKIQGSVGGKNRLRTIQEEMKTVQLALIEAGKRKDSAESDNIMKKYWSLTGELMKIQFQLLAVLLVVLFAFMAIFPHFEPGGEDDIRAQMFDDGASSHCDAVLGDGIYSGCFAIPANARTGAWTADYYILSDGNETLARNASALFVEGGALEDVWLQSSSQNGIIDSAMGKKTYHINASQAQNVTRGQQVALFASPMPALPQGARLEGVLNAGTQYYIDLPFAIPLINYIDLPFAIPLINIRRIIGSYGVFLFAAFVVSIAYSMGKAVYSGVMKKK